MGDRTREDADAGVIECMNLMADGLWVSGKSHAEVAAKHGVSPATVKNWATNASRILRLGTEEEAEDARARCVATLDTIVAIALQKKGIRFTDDDEAEYTLPEPDLRAAVSAVGEKAKLLGLIVQKHDVRTAPKVAHLSRKEHLEQLEQLEQEIAAEVKRLEAEGSE